MAQFVHAPQPYKYNIKAEENNDQRWYTVRNGIKYPSVTTVIGYGPKLWLEEWKKNLGPEKAAAETLRCQERGERVHEMAELYLKNDRAPTANQLESNIKLFNQIKLPLNKINNIRLQERPLFSDRLRLAGRVDVVGEYDGVLRVIDFKTSNNNKYNDMVHDYFLQCTAYAIMYQEMFDVTIDEIAVIIAVERGIVPMVYVKKIDEYVKPLLERINTFYEDHP